MNPYYRLGRALFLVLLSLFNPALLSAQIISPDTVCFGVPVNFTTTAEGAAFTWNFEPVNLSFPPPASAIVYQGTPLATPTFITLTNDNGQWYSLTCNYFTNQIIRLSYGNSPDNTPTITGTWSNMGTGGLLEGIEVIKDNGNYFGFAVNASQLIRLDFGNALSNTPSATIMNYPANLAWPHQINIRKFGNQWIGFVANRSGAITRLDFGTAITTTPPVATNLPITNYHNPCNFALYQQNGNWHMLVTDLVGPSELSRIDFGPDIQNNTPATVNLGNPGGFLNIPRSLTIFSDCEELYAYLLNETGELLKLNFNNDITSVPVYSVVGTYSSTNNAFLPYIYDNNIKALLISWGSNTIFRLNLSPLPASSITTYGTPGITHTFATPGIYNVTLWIDQGNIMGPTALCKQIVVVNGGQDLLGADTVVCTGQGLTLDAQNANATSYQWSTGETTPSIVVNNPGTYWVHIDGQVCTADDTIQVDFSDVAIINASPADTSLCLGESIRLSASGAASYTWSPQQYLDNPNTDKPNATPPLGTTQFIVEGTTSGGCHGMDTVTIFIKPLPDVGATADATELNCNGSLTTTLHATGGNTYQWWPATSMDNDKSKDPVVTPNTTTTFYVTGTDINGCSNTDSVTINVVLDTRVFVPNAFSPNGDTHNDLFSPNIYCDFTLITFNVYNRYGQMVYHTDVAGQGWNGLFKDKAADVGVYFWYLEGKNSKGEIIRKKGDVLLLR